MSRDEKMSELGVLIDWWFPPRLKLMLLIVFLKLFANTEFVRGNPASAGNDKLQCVTDYLFTINCSLNIPPNTSDRNSSFWLNVAEKFDEEIFTCLLIQTGGHYFCTLQIDTPDPDYEQPNGFIETQTYKFFLCHKLDGVENCKLLTDKFKPYKNIKPNTPCCLKLSHESGKYHFTWESTYEEYSSYTTLPDELEFQLHYYKRGHKLDNPQRMITVTGKTNFSTEDHNFSPDTEYHARVRSSPDQTYYEGEWSSWSSEIQWRTNPAVSGGTREFMGTDPGSDTVMSKLGIKVFIPLAVVALLSFFLLCYAPIKKWRQRSYIPTPAPYFHTLYHDCQGDFKSWVVTQGNTADTLKAEETLKIDTLTKCADDQEAEEEEEGRPQCQHYFMEGSTYSNITDPGCDTSLLGLPYAVSTMPPALSYPGSSPKSLTFSSPLGSPTEGDSGCWLSSHASLEKDPSWYCNEYCTLSAFQRTGPASAMKPCTGLEEQSGSFTEA